MRNNALLLLLAGAAVANGLMLDRVPVWRQALFPLLAAAAYVLGRRFPVRRGLLLIAIAALPAAVLAVFVFSEGVGGLLSLGLFVVLPWLAGGYQRQQAALVRAGDERVAQLEREQEFVRLRERSRIASDMHDSLGHDLALIALRAGALELAPDMSDPGRAAATQLREAAVAATDRLRTTVHLLRDGDTTPPAPVSALVASSRSAGLTVHFTGADTTDPTAHRVVRESLTNATRHAPGAPITITITDDSATTTVKIQNPLTGTPTATPPGTGLAGLRERVTLLGGTLEAAATSGTFTVTATFPTTRPTPPPDSHPPVTPPAPGIRPLADPPVSPAGSRPPTSSSASPPGSGPSIAAPASPPDSQPSGGPSVSPSGSRPPATSSASPLGSGPSIAAPASPPGSQPPTTSSTSLPGSGLLIDPSVSLPGSRPLTDPSVSPPGSPPPAGSGERTEASAAAVEGQIGAGPTTGVEPARAGVEPAPEAR